ncbi:hypothetical protein BV22DRAFT_1037445 [Leucogyrophana mollusca]|uniref:Uncharacterized protein n=1 Tax=Leucogyrophana mollusca TaxID=85980 RepID=A0ACB8BCA2_9AGAM|nr:hypothetical protein BV22DRAFT_1037445 [Leucogyrophana mollusca]
MDTIEFSAIDLYEMEAFERSSAPPPAQHVSDETGASDERDTFLNSGKDRAAATGERTIPHQTPNLLSRTCHALHLTVILIHACLLVLWARRTEHRVTVPIGVKSNLVSVGLTITQQTFSTLYLAGMVAVAQQLALNRNLLRCQTLTATHDQSGAWTGLGAALLSLFRQLRVPAAVWGVLSVTLYLICVAILHVSSSSLFNLEVFNATYQTSTQTTLGMPNLTDIFAFTNDWSASTAVASTVGQLSELSTIGVMNGTVFDSLLDTSGIDNATVNATTFGVDCFTLPNITATRDVTNLTYSVTSTVGDEQIYFMGVYPYYQNVLKFFPLAGTAPTPGRQVGLLAIPPIIDSRGDAGSIFQMLRPINQTGPNGTEPNELVSVQAMACSLYLINQTAIVDAQTNELLRVEPALPPDESQWVPWEWPPIDTAEDDSIDWFWFAFDVATPSATTYTMESNSCKAGCRLSMLEKRLMNLLGRYVDVNSVNQSTVVSPSLKLGDLEGALANVAAAMVWSGARVNSSVPFSGQPFDVATGETLITKAFPLSRLNINILPVVVGLGASIALFVLSALLVHDSHNGAGAPSIGSAGLLEVVWLSSRQSSVRERISEVPASSERGLRKAGLFLVSLGRVPESNHEPM